MPIDHPEGLENPVAKWTVVATMVALVLLIGTDHPPTRDDSVKLGWFRTVLGISCLAIPLFCFAPEIIVFRE